MNIAEETRRAVRRHPFLVEALRAGVVNYTAAARFLDVGETDAVSAALRRFAEDLGPRNRAHAALRIRMITGVGETTDGDEALLRVMDRRFASGTGDRTGILARGALDSRFVSVVWSRLAVADIEVEAAGFDGEHLLLVVARGDGPHVIELLEETAGSHPEEPRGAG